MAELQEDNAGFQFPCAYQVKAMGYNEAGFHEVVLRIVRRHCRENPPDRDSVRKKISKTGKYVSVTVLIEARSRAQLDAIYEELTCHEQVLARL